MAVAPLAGQNVGARHVDRVKETFRIAVGFAVMLALVLIGVCHVAPAAMVRIFSDDAQVIAVGEEYLRIASWNFVAAATVFVTASMFQAVGNTVPSLMASMARLVFLAVPILWLARLPGFELRWIWYLTIGATTLQLAMALLLLRRELEIRLAETHPAEMVGVVDVDAVVM
jgi:Na+-driven multidrug efflux pump